jgi:hypothetical protein
MPPPNRPDRSVYQAPVQHQAGSQGLCLYFGPAGQRCSRPALPGGFCERHRPELAVEDTPPSTPRRAIAILTALAALWPVLSTLLRELFRWLHRH